MRILITGGPVHAHLDVVKHISNGFRGGYMCELADTLARTPYEAEVLYVCAPKVGAQMPESRKVKVLRHQGFDDYLRIVREFAPQMDAVILGAAVANLIPKNPWKGKFPSHDYKPGDTIPIDFTIAPRVIDEVKKVAPKAHLFGYKFLDNVPHEELIRAAYGIVLEARATAVFANDGKDLDQKFAVTKERGVHPMKARELAPWIWQMLQDEYYSTANAGDVGLPADAAEMVRSLIEQHKDRFLHTEADHIFGTVAVRWGKGFVTTGRGKRELDSIVYVTYVNHASREVHVANGVKASLNAPLLARMFDNLDVDHIVHFHEQVESNPTYDYAPPGTVRDTNRPNTCSFNIEEHGTMLLYRKDGQVLT